MKYLSFLFLFLSLPASSEMLLTKNYKVEITWNCGEGYVSCDDITYVGTNINNGKSITLKGRSNHSICADGVSPCKFQGYTFINGNIAYHIYSNGTLEVVRNDSETLLSEKGEWEY